MMFHYALYVSWILLWNCYAHQTYPQLSESSQSQRATIQKRTPVTIRQEDLRDLRSSVATRLQENQLKKTRDVIASVPRDSDKALFVSLETENEGVSTLNPPSIDKKPPLLRSVSNDKPNDSLKTNSDTGTKLASSYDTIKNKGIHNRRNNERAIGRPGNKQSYYQIYKPTRPTHKPPYNPVYQSSNNPGNGAPGQKPDMSKPSVISCNLSPMNPINTVGFVMDTPFFLVGRRKRAVLSVPVSIN